MTGQSAYGQDQGEGWITFVGILQILAGFGVFARNQAARWCGVAIAGVNLVAALTSINAYPFWGITVVAIDVLVIYGLTAYGGRLQAA